MLRAIKRLFWLLIYNSPISSEQRINILRRHGIKIGRRCRILAGLQAFGGEPYLIRIGDHVEITSGVRFITHDGATWVLRERQDWQDGINRFGKIDIRDNSFIGVNAIILPGVTIGPDAIVAAGSVVTRDVPPGVIVAGNPARVISNIDAFYDKCAAEAVPGLSYSSTHQREKLISHFWGRSD